MEENGQVFSDPLRMTREERERYLEAETAELKAKVEQLLGDDDVRELRLQQAMEALRG